MFIIKKTLPRRPSPALPVREGVVTRMVISLPSQGSWRGLYSLPHREGRGRVYSWRVCLLFIFSLSNTSPCPCHPFR